MDLVLTSRIRFRSVLFQKQVNPCFDDLKAFPWPARPIKNDFRKWDEMWIFYENLLSQKKMGVLALKTITPNAKKPFRKKSFLTGPSSHTVTRVVNFWGAR